MLRMKKKLSLGLQNLFKTYKNSFFKESTILIFFQFNVYSLKIVEKIRQLYYL